MVTLIILLLSSLHLCQNGTRALHFAAMTNHLPCVEALLARGAAVNAADNVRCLLLLLLLAGQHTMWRPIIIFCSMVFKDGLTALMMASRKGFTNCIELLMVHGADMDAQNSVSSVR